MEPLTSNLLPKLFIMGTKDNFTGPVNFGKAMKIVQDPKSIHLEEGRNHFWFEEEFLLGDVILNWLMSLPPSSL